MTEQQPRCRSSLEKPRPRGPMDKASAYGAGDCRFESCRGHCMRVSDMCSFSRETRKCGEANTRHTQHCQLTTLPPTRSWHPRLHQNFGFTQRPPYKCGDPPADKPCVSPSVCTVTITHMHAHMPCLVFPCVWDRRAHAHS